MELIAYLRVSTQEQEDSGKGLAAQRRKISRYAEAHDHEIVQWLEDVASGKDGNGRPGLQKALDLLAAGEADGLIVNDVSRASRGIVHGASILEQAREEGWVFLALDVQLDTSTPMGEAMTNLVLVFAQLERRLISERTKAALHEAKVSGVRLGRKSTVSEDVRRHIVRLRAKGLSQERIADWLNDKGYTTATGARWRHKAVGRALRSIRLDEDAKAAR